MTLFEFTFKDPLEIEASQSEETDLKTRRIEEKHLHKKHSYKLQSDIVMGIFIHYFRLCKKIHRLHCKILLHYTESERAQSVIMHQDRVVI